jgi:hypothetical protein
MLACKTKHSGGQGKRIQVQELLGLHNEFQANLGFIMRLCLKKENKKHITFVSKYIYEKIAINKNQ